MSSCIVLATIDDSYDFVNTKTPKARKHHTCCECRRKIEPGETYVWETCMAQGDFDVFKTCMDCYDFRAKVVCNFFYEYLWEGFKEYLNYLEDEDEIPWGKIGSLRFKAREKALEIIQEYFDLRDSYYSNG